MSLKDLQTLCFKKSQEIRLFITIIYCSDLLCFLIAQFTKKRFPCCLLYLSVDCGKYLTLIYKKASPVTLSLISGGSIENEFKMFQTSVKTLIIRTTIFNHTENSMSNNNKWKNDVFLLKFLLCVYLGRRFKKLQF